MIDEASDWLAAANAFRTQHRLRQRFATLSIAGQPLSPRDAYAVQAQHVAELRREFTSEVAGYKTGLTSAAMQRMCCIAHAVSRFAWALALRADGARLGRTGREGVKA